MLRFILCACLVAVAQCADNGTEFSSLPLPSTSTTALTATAARSDIECTVKCMSANFGCSAAAFAAKTGTCFMAAVRDADFSIAAPGSAVFRKRWDGFYYTYVQVDSRTFRVIQQRSKGQLSFARKWTEYEDGFGDDTDFWLGLRTIHDLTGSSPGLLRMEAVTWAGVLYVSEFSGFTLGAASVKYALNYGLYLSGSSNTTGDGLEYHKTRMFSTIDNDNDVNSGSCSQTRCGGGGWFYGSCSYSNPNGLYYTSAVSNAEVPMYWYYAGSNREALKSIRLMLLV